MRLTTTIQLWLSLLWLPRPAVQLEALSLLQSEAVTAEARKKLKVKSEVDLEDKLRPEAGAESEQRAKEGSKPEAKAQPKADRAAQRKAKADAKSDTEQGADAEAAAQLMGKGRRQKADASADAEAGTETEQGVEAEADTNHKGKAETKRQRKAKAEAAAKQEQSQQQKAEAEAEAELAQGVEAEAEADAEGKQDNKAEAKGQAEAEAGAASDQGVEAETAIQHTGKGRRQKSEAGADTKGQRKAKAEAAAEQDQAQQRKAEADAEGKQNNKANANVQVEAESGTEAEQAVEAEASIQHKGKGRRQKAEAGAEAEAGTEAQQGVEADAEVDAEGKQKGTAETNVQAEADAEAGSEAEAGAELEQGAEAEAEADAEGKQANEAEATDQAEADAEGGQEGTADTNVRVEAEAEVQHRGKGRRQRAEAGAGAEAGAKAEQGAEAEAEAEQGAEEALEAGEEWPKSLKFKKAKAKHAESAGADEEADGSRQLASSKAARRQKGKAGDDFVPNWVKAQETQETDLQKRLGSTPGSPEAPGCYVWAPTGCPNHLSFVASTWQHDSFGEDFGGAKQNESLCSDMRGRHFRQWCGAEDVQMLWIAEDAILEQPETSMLLSQDAPQSSGCYVQLPLGCPRHPTFKAERWTIDPSWDIYEETATRQTCDRRGPKFAHWCGAQEGQVKMLFVQMPSNATRAEAEPSSRSRSALPVAPSEPGCYSFVPYGCPQHPQRSSSSWKKEAYPKAGENQGVCEARERALMKWCGTSEVKMLFVHDVLADDSSEAEQSEQEKYGSPAAEHASAGATAAEVATAAEAPAEPDEFMPAAMEAAHPEVPAEPGCYVFTPQGCPQNGLFEKESTTRWVRDVYGEKHMGAGTDRAVCEGRGKSHYAPWCGTPSVETVFVTGAGGTSEAPSELWVPETGAQSGNRLAHTSSKRTRAPQAESEDESALREAGDAADKVAKATESDDEKALRELDEAEAPQPQAPETDDEKALREADEVEEQHHFVESALEAEATKKGEKPQYSDEPLPALITDVGAEAKPLAKPGASPQYSDEPLPALAVEAGDRPKASQYSDEPLPDPSEEAKNKQEDAVKSALESAVESAKALGSDGAGAKGPALDVAAQKAREFLEALKAAEGLAGQGPPSGETAATVDSEKNGTAEKHSNEELPSMSRDGTTDKYSTKELPSIEDAADQVWQRFQDAMDKKYSKTDLPFVSEDDANENIAKHDFNGELSNVSQEKDPPLIHDDGYPELPGCYMRMPSGCPSQATTAQLWRHDVQAEQDKLTVAQCKLRKPDWDGYCGVGDVQMVFVSLTQTGARVVSKTQDSTASQYSNDDLPSVSEGSTAAEDSKDEPAAAEGSSEEQPSDGEDVDANPPEDEDANPPDDEDAADSAGEHDDIAEKYSNEELPSMSEDGTADTYSNEELPSMSENVIAEKYANMELPSVSEDATAEEYSSRELPSVGEDATAEKYSDRELSSVSEDTYSNKETPYVGEDATAAKQSKEELPSASKSEDAPGPKDTYSSKETPYVSEDATATTYSKKELPSVGKSEDAQGPKDTYSNKETPYVSDDATATTYSRKELLSVGKSEDAQGPKDTYSNKETPYVSDDATATTYSRKGLPSVGESENGTAAKISKKELPHVEGDGAATKWSEKEPRSSGEDTRDALQKLLQSPPGERFKDLHERQMKIHEALREKRLRRDAATSKYSMKELPSVDQGGEHQHAPATTYSKKELPFVDQDGGHQRAPATTYSKKELPFVDQDATATKYSNAELPSVEQDVHSQVPLPTGDGEAATASYSTEALPSVDRKAEHVTHSDEGLPSVDKAAQRVVDEHRQPPGLPKAGEMADDMEWDTEPEKEATPGKEGPAESPVRPHAVGGQDPEEAAPQVVPAPAEPEPGAEDAEEAEPVKAGDSPVELPVDPAAKELWEAKNAHFSEREAKEAYKRIRASRAAQEQSQELARVWDPEMNLMLLGLAIWLLGCVGISELRRVGQLKPAPKN